MPLGRQQDVSEEQGPDIQKSEGKFIFEDARGRRAALDNLAELAQRHHRSL
jgi:hypothetical protein